jgi:serine phosphatase RsbU (regulator of sigma subunit)
MLLNLTYYSSEPIHNQIVNQVLLRIQEEDKFPGDELDQIGKISRQHHVGKASIKKAFQKLEQLGVIHCTANEKYIINDISTRALKILIDRNNQNSQSISEYDLFNAELNAAKQIQNGLLPKNLPNNDILDVAAYSTISDDVGGDFYDFFEIDNNKYGIIIGDASGKGFPAAMLISQIQAIIKSDLSLNRSILETVHLINSYLNTYTAARNFATMFYGILDSASGQFNYINAGHNFPIIFEKKSTVKRLKTTGPALGIMANANYSENCEKISPGDLIFIFTDGLSERMNKDGLQFGEKRIINTLQNSFQRASELMVDEIKKEVSEFSNGQNELDDTTFMAVQLKNFRKVN